MGTVSLVQEDGLFWLGRYTERVYTTIQFYAACFDKLLDDSHYDYSQFCEHLGIPNIYTSSDDFIQRYCFDEANPDSIISNMMKAYDNAIVLREELGSAVLSYIQLAVYDIHKAAASECPLIDLQQVMDHIAAFWGMADDRIEDDQIRDIIVTGRRIERVDLYARLKLEREKLSYAVRKLSHRISRSEMSCNEQALKELLLLVDETYMDYNSILSKVNQIILPAY